ncbi:MAG: hypothetical protein HYS81_05330 [Candidatus Aenigmatarchaeota archaeon]|nr:MAG: hypothetical protein HYS81_05330 [Candidatus Aenigmarchaeota archaeon]
MPELQTVDKAKVRAFVSDTLYGLAALEIDQTEEMRRNLRENGRRAIEEMKNGDIQDVLPSDAMLDGINAHYGRLDKLYDVLDGGEEPDPREVKEIREGIHSFIRRLHKYT